MQRVNCAHNVLPPPALKASHDKQERPSNYPNVFVGVSVTPLQRGALSHRGERLTHVTINEVFTERV